MTAKRRLFNAEDACRIGDRLGVDWSQVELEEFRRGLVVEREHVTRFRIAGSRIDALVTTAKIAWARIRRVPDYYTREARRVR